jgi:hypothetical protein
MTTAASAYASYRLYLPDGSPLADGFAHDLRSGSGGQRVTLVIERPHRLLQECLLGGRRELNLARDGGPRQPATVEKIYFDHGVGRICVLSVPDEPAA